MKIFLKRIVLTLLLVIGCNAFAQIDHGYDLPEMDNIEEAETEILWVSSDEIIFEENILPSLDLSDELPKLDEILQVYFNGAEDFVIEQELKSTENTKTKSTKSKKHCPLKLYPIDNDYDLPEMDSINKM